MVVRTLLLACACVAISSTGVVIAGDADELTEAVPMVLGEGVVGGDDGPPAEPPGEIRPDGMFEPDSAMEDAPSAEAPVWPADVVSPCTAGPKDSVAYATVDALFMERANTAGPLALQSWFTDNPGATVISAGDVRYPVMPGARVFQGWRHCDAWGWEAGYLGVWSMHADALATSPDGSLALPGQLGLEVGSGFDAATAIRPAVNGNLNSFELNVFASRSYDGCRQHDPLPWRRSWGVLRGTVATADWLLGVRWAGLDETATLDVTALADATPTPPVFHTTRYRVTSSSQLVGPQIGHRRRIEWDNWAVEGWAKAALAASLLTQSQSSVIRPFDLDPVRGPQSGSRAGVGMIGDVNATLVRRFGDHWGLRAGYSLLWFTGVAPAANQWNFTLDPTGGTGVVVDTVFLHGASLGLEASW